MTLGGRNAKRQNRFNSGNPSSREDTEMVDLVDELSEFEEFQRDILPMLKKAIKEGWSAEKIYRMTEAHAAARTVTIALTENDSGKALAAIKETMDRSKGKSVERRELKAEISDLSDADLDALLEEQLTEVTDATKETKISMPN